MARHVYDEFSRVPMSLDTNDQVWLFTKRSAIIDTEGSVEVAALGLSGSRNTYLINGTITSLDRRGIQLAGVQQELTIGETGSVTGEYTGIGVSGSDNACINYGWIFAPTATTDAGGVALNGERSSFTNYGIVQGTTAGVAVNETNTQIINQKGGEIHGYEHAIAASFLSAPGLNIVNRGLIEAQSGEAIYGYSGKDRLLNEGRIVGDVILGDGDDRVTVNGGSITGNLFGGQGNDTLITDNAKTKLIEVAGEGNDGVRSSVTYTLPDNVEILTLLGKKDINATGNDDANTDNVLYGNAGDNVLRGLGGTNVLFGKGGSDTLVGGHGFEFFGIGKGYGHDTVKGYTDGEDVIILDHINVPLSQIKSHIDQHGADTWLEFGKDVLILKGIDHRVLDTGDFTYVM